MINFRLIITLLLLSIVELIIVILFNNNAKFFASYLLFSFFVKITILLYFKHKITSPILFPTVVILFWYVFANYLNIITMHYPKISDAFNITYLIVVSYISFCIGIMFSFFIKLKSLKRVFPYISYSSFLKILYTLIIISLFFQFIYDIPIINALRNGTYFENRIDMIYNRGYLAVAGSLQFYFLMYLLIVKFYNKQKINFIDYFLLLISFFLMAIPMNRGPLLIYILMIIFVYNDFKHKISMKYFIIFGVVIVSLFGVLIPYLRGVDRLFIIILTNEIGIHMWNLTYYIDIVDENTYFGLRPIWMALAIIMPGHQEDFVIWIKQFSPISVDIGGASMSLIGEGYLEFGVIGVIVNFIFLGILLMVLYKRKKYSLGSYFLYLYILIRSNSILQFGYAKVLLTVIILTVILLSIDHIKLKKNVHAI